MNTILLRRIVIGTKCFQKNKYASGHLCCLSTNVQLQKNENLQSTVDVHEVTKHSKLMEEWWNPNGPMKPLHSFNLIRVPFVRDGLVPCPPIKTVTPLKGKKILDVGCGGGILSEALARLGAETTGIDASRELIELADKHSSKDPKLEYNRPSYICCPIEVHAKQYANHYDAIVASEIIEHIDNQNKEYFIKSCIHTLKPGGKIFFTTPTRTLISQLTTIFLAETLLNIIPRGTHQYEKFTTPVELTFLLERSGCHVELTQGIFYNLWSNTWSFVNDQSLLFGLQAIKL